jgi:hypothetical protein
MTHENQLAICIEKWKQFDEHARESVSVRDRLRDVEIKVEVLEKAVMRNAIIGGLIGALIGSGASPALIHIIEIILKVG